MRSGAHPGAVCTARRSTALLGDLGQGLGVLPYSKPPAAAFDWQELTFEMKPTCLSSGSALEKSTGHVYLDWEGGKMAFRRLGCTA